MLFCGGCILLTSSKFSGMSCFKYSKWKLNCKLKVQASMEVFLFCCIDLNMRSLVLCLVKIPCEKKFPIICCYGLDLKTNTISKGHINKACFAFTWHYKPTVALMETHWTCDEKVSGSIPAICEPCPSDPMSFDGKEVKDAWRHPYMPYVPAGQKIPEFLSFKTRPGGTHFFP